MKTKKKYQRCRFTLNECKTQINIIEKSDDPGYARAYLNVQLPDGRWIVFTTDRDSRIPIYKTVPREEEREY